MHRFTALLIFAAPCLLLSQGSNEETPAPKLSGPDAKTALLAGSMASIFRPAKTTASSKVSTAPSAQNASQQTKPTKELRSHLQLGGNYTWAQITPNGHTSASGNLGGAQALYEFKAPKTVYGALSLAWSTGNMENGNDRSITYVDAQERLGYTFGTWRGWWTCTLFTGFGYRHYGEDVSSSEGSVDFNYDEFYFPLGFLTSNKVNSCFAIGLNFQWMPQVYSTVKINPLKGARWILTNKIGNFRAQMPFVFTVSQKHHCFIVFEPFFEYWQDGKTTATTELGTSLDIPKNTYVFAGANLNIGVSF